MLQPGTRVANRYTVRRPLGSGGMGGVWEIEGDALGNRLALKVIRAELLKNPSVAARFEREALIQSRLSHPGIARVFDFIEHEGMRAIVMEFVEAPTLRQRMAEARMRPAEARQVVMELMSALVAAHHAEVVHRDLKPENVFVFTDHCGTVRCKLIDFGIAKSVSAADRRANQKLTKTNVFVGTSAYASPEQVQRDDVDARSDLYSAGVLLWEMLAGVAPYGDLTSAYAVQDAVVNRPLPALPHDVPDDLRRVIVELTRKDADERPQSAREVLGIVRRATTPSLSGDTGFGPFPTANSRANTQIVPVSAPPMENRPVDSQPRTVMAPAAVRQSRVRETPSPAVPASPRSPQRQESTPTPPRPTSRVPPVSQGAPSDASIEPLAASATAWRSATLQERAGSRLAYELLPMILVFTCIGIILYPFFGFFRGVHLMGNPHKRYLELEITDVSCERLLSGSDVRTRNGIDTLWFGLPLALAVSPVAWAGSAGFLPVVAIAWLFVTVSLDVYLILADPLGQRVVDRMCGTRVCVRA